MKLKNTVLITTLFLVLVFNLVSAQNIKYSVKGKVIEKSTGNPISYAQIILYSTDKKLLTSGVTSDKEGSFNLSVNKDGNYYVVVTFIGFLPDTTQNINLNEQTPDVLLPKILLSQKALMLNEVQVTATKPLLSNKIDKKIYTVADFETAQSGTAVDILKMLPSVSVSPDNEVSVRGTTGFMVYLNGKATQLDPSILLSQIPASSIKNIEIITVPSAKYDAQGKAGIINIISTQKSIGTSISADATIGGAPWHTKWDPFRNHAGINITHNKEKLLLYGSANFKNLDGRGIREGDARLLQSDGSYYHMVAQGNRPQWQPNYFAQAGVEYRFTVNSSLALSYYYGNKIVGRTAKYIYHVFYGDIYKYPVESKENSYIFNPNTRERIGIFQSGQIKFSHQFSKKTGLNISALYEHSKLNSDFDNQNFLYNNQTKTVGSLQKHYYQHDENPLDGYRLSIDFEHEIKNNHLFEFGIQPQYLIQEGIFSYDTLEVATEKWYDNQQFENSVELKRGIYAGYMSLSGKLGASFEYQTGLRSEYTTRLLQVERPDYLNIFGRETKRNHKIKQTDWFPSLHLNYNLKNKFGINFAVSKRINRPPTKNMAPFLTRRHYEVYLVGDPALKPEYITKAELTLSAYRGKQDVHLTGFYRATDNVIFRVNTVYEEENVLIRSFTNAGNDHAIGAELNTNLAFGNKAKLFVGGSLYHYSIKGEIFEFDVNTSSLNWQFKSNLNIFISNSIKLNWDIDVNSATVTSQGENDLFYLSNLAFNYNPQKNKDFTFVLRIFDIFGTNDKGLFTRGFNKTGTEIFYQTTTYHFYGPILEFGLSYQFNKHPKSIEKSHSAFGEKEF